VRARVSARRSTGRVRLIAALLLAGACVGQEVGPSGNPVPVIEGTAPEVIVPGPSGAEVYVSGRGFLESSEVLWNGSSRPSTFVGPEALTVVLDGADLSAGGQISVRNPEPGGGVSVPFDLSIGHPVPTLDGLTPSSGSAVIERFLTFQATGSDFVIGPPSAYMLFRGVPVETNVSSSTELTATVPDYLLRSGGDIPVTVFNPGPGGGASNALTLALANPLPTVDGIDPPGLLAGSGNYPYDVLGTGFVPDATVRIDGQVLPSTLVAEGRLRIRVPSDFTMFGSSPSLTVENPAPGGGLSAPVALEVWAWPPRIDNYAPEQLLTGPPDFTLWLDGSFAAGATVTVDGVPVTPSSVSTGLIEVPLTGADFLTAGSVDVVVSLPGTPVTDTATIVVIDRPPAPQILTLKRLGDAWGVAGPDGVEVANVNTRDPSLYMDASITGLEALFPVYGGMELVDMATGLIRYVTTDVQLVDQRWPRFSADGAFIYLMARVPSVWEIWRVPTAGGPPEPVLQEASDVGHPAPSHAGDRLAYSIGIDPLDSSTELAVLDIGTGVSTPLGVWGTTSRWTPDDAWIVYRNGDGDLRAVRPDGTDDFQLTTGLQLGPGFDVSPDGSEVIAPYANESGAVRIAFPSGTVETLPGLGAVRALAWVGP